MDGGDALKVGAGVVIGLTIAGGLFVVWVSKFFRM